MLAKKYEQITGEELPVTKSLEGKLAYKAKTYATKRRLIVESEFIRTDWGRVANHHVTVQERPDGAEVEIVWMAGSPMSVFLITDDPVNEEGLELIVGN